MQAVTLNNGVEMPILGFGVFGSFSPQEHDSLRTIARAGSSKGAMLFARKSAA